MDKTTVRCEVTRAFRFAHEGIRVVDYAPGEQDLPKEVAELAIGEGWVRPLALPKGKGESGRPSPVSGRASAAPSSAAGQASGEKTSTDSESGAAESEAGSLPLTTPGS